MARRRSTRAEREKHVRAWRASRQSARAYAARVRINPNTLLGWSWQLKRQADAESLTARRIDFAELPGLTASRSCLAIELELGGVTLRVPDGFDPATLRGILDVLEARS